MSSRPLIFAIIVTYNGDRWIENCLQSLKDSRYPVQIIVLDNGSTDSTKSIVEGFSHVWFVPLRDNVGFGRANNIGMRLALSCGANYVFLLNQDAQVLPDTITTLVEVAENNKSHGIVSPVHLDGEGNQLDAKFAQHVANSSFEFVSDAYFGRDRDVYDVRFVNAAAWLLSKRCMTTVGGFDPIFHMYGEDNDYCDRSHLHRFKVGVAGKAVVLHSRGTNEKSHSGSWARRIDNLDRASSVLVNQNIVILKRHSHSFIYQMAKFGVDSSRQLASALSRLDFHHALAIVVAFFRTVVLLPRAFAHRRAGQHQGTHWLYIRSDMAKPRQKFLRDASAIDAEETG